MSDQPTPSPSPAEYLDELHRALSGNRLPGGCDDCDAYQTLTKAADGFYVVTVHHDDTCPWLGEKETR